MNPQAPYNAAHETRLDCRAGALTGPTSGLASGHVQANLLILPSSAAAHFRSLCARNPVPCPLLGSTPISAIGNPSLLDNASLIHNPSDFDIRTDLPLYNIYENGELVAQKRDILQEWTSDHVAFLIGCSFSFEAALAREGYMPRHWETAKRWGGGSGGGNVPMYKTTRPLNPAGIFTDGYYVVSMRPYQNKDIHQVRCTTRPFESMHGEPIAWGWDAMRELGIEDINKPDFGEKVEFRNGEVPVFWGCGVTPQVSVMKAGHQIKGTVMAHAPGHMLVLDMTEEDVMKTHQNTLENYRW